MVSSDAPPAAPRVRVAPGGARSGARSGALLAAASLAATALNYVFLVAAGRLLGTSDYGDLAALTGLLTVILLPTGALQLAVSREVARELALDNRQGADAFGRAAVRLGLFVTVPLVALGLALAVPLKNLLHIQSTGVVVLAMLGLLAALVFPIASGILQGYQRFNDIAALYVTPFVLRLALLALLAAAGYRLGGAMFAASMGGLGGAALALALASDSLKRGARVVRPSLRPFLHYLWPVLVGLIGIAVLTNLDLLVVKARFPGDTGGHYAVASAFARVAFFLPATILAVLFPRTVARQARGKDTADILGRSLLVTAGFGAALTLLYAMAGRGLVVASFGADFAPAGELLAPLAIAMTLFALANVLVGFHLSRDETRYAWIVAAAIPVQVVVLALVPHSVRTVIWADVAVAALLLAAHELLVGSSVPALRAGLLHFRQTVPVARVREVALESLLVLLGMTAFVCLLFIRLLPHLGSMVVGSGSDAAGQITEFWWMQHEGGYHLLGSTHHTLTGAPFGWNGGNGVHIQALVPYYPAYLATKLVGPIAAYNLVLLSGYVLSGAAMHLLARYLGCARLVSAWAGLIYIVVPWHLARTPHASLVHLEFLPLLVLALVAAARRPSWLRFALVGLATLACWLTAGYFGAMALVAACAFALTLPLTSSLRRGARTAAGLVGSALAATLLVALLSILSGFGRGADLPDRVAADLSIYGLRPLELVVPAAGNILLRGRLDGFLAARQHGSNFTETSDYVGFLTLALVALCLVVAWRRRKVLAERVRTAILGLVAIAVAALLLAAPSPVHVLGHSLVMPSRLLWDLIPAIRVPARWVALLVTALVPLAALGLQAVWERLDSRRTTTRKVAPAAVAVVLLAMLVSFLELAISPTKPSFRTHPVPPLYAALERTPPGIVAEYPLVTTNDHIIWQTVYKRPLLNNAEFGTPADDARRVVLDPASPQTAPSLALLGVTAIVTHRNALRYTDVDGEAPNASWGPGYRLVYRTADGSSVWQVVAPPAPALVTMYSGFGDPLPPSNGRVEFPFTSPSGVGYLEIRAKKPAALRLEFDAEPPAGSSRVLRVTDEQTEVPVTLRGPTHVSVNVAVPGGLSRLLLKTDPAATSVDDAIKLTAPLAVRTSETPTLHAEPVAPDVGF